MNFVKETQKTTLLLNMQWMPINVITAKSAIHHILCGKIRPLDRFYIPIGTLNKKGKCVDGADIWFKNKDILLNNTNNENYSIYYKNQPVLRSQKYNEEYQIWPIPTISLTTSTYWYKPKVGRFSLKQLAIRYDYTCQICEQRFKLNDLTIEHIIPKAKGGDNSHQNIILTCKHCNQKKSDIYPYKDHNEINLETKVKKIPLVLNVQDINIRKEWEPFLFIGPKDKNIHICA